MCDFGIKTHSYTHIFVGSVLYQTLSIMSYFRDTRFLEGKHTVTKEIPHSQSKHTCLAGDKTNSAMSTDQKITEI